MLIRPRDVVFAEEFISGLMTLMNTLFESIGLRSDRHYEHCSGTSDCMQLPVLLSPLERRDNFCV